MSTQLLPRVVRDWLIRLRGGRRRSETEAVLERAAAQREAENASGRSQGRGGPARRRDET